MSSFQVWCSTDCQIVLALKKLRSVESARRKELMTAERKVRVEESARRMMAKPLAKLCAETQIYVNRLFRMIDIVEYDRCISCGASIDDAGHYHAVGMKYRCNRLRFMRENINGQCAPCNRFVGGGNKKAYADGYADRYGEDALEVLNGLRARADRGEFEPLTKEEVLDTRYDAQRKIAEIKKNM